MRVPFRLVDVFTDRPLAGNQLCVVAEPLDLPSELMQAVAREIGFSETTFVTEVGDARYAMRIFTPGAELSFAGHPSLGTAFVMVSEGRTASPVVQSTAAGEVPIEVEVTPGGTSGRARMRQLPPSFGPELHDAAAVADAVGLSPGDLHPELPPQVVSTGGAQLLVPVADAGAVVRAASDRRGLAALVEGLGTHTAYVFAAKGDRARARLFAVGLGIDEDPATGSAAGPLGAYLWTRGLLPGGRLEISQGAEIGRPSTLSVEVEPGEGAPRVFVGGGVVRVGEGVFELPSP